MSNCCANSFYSTVYATPDCAVDCLSAATPGAIFVGSTGRIYILTGEDPCNLSHWYVQGACCLSFTNLSDNYIVCCNEDVILTSLDNSVVITVSELGIDLSANLGDITPTYTFIDSDSNSFNLSDGDSILITGDNGVKVSIVAEDEIVISGNTYSGVGAPVSNPDHEDFANYYLDTSVNELYAWNPIAIEWAKVGNKFTAIDEQPDSIPTTPTIASPPSNPIPNDIHMVVYADGFVLWIYNEGTWVEFATYIQPVSLPVANFSYTAYALSADVDGGSSTSTQAGVTLEYEWTGSGPGVVTFDTPTASDAEVTVTVPGIYTIVLTVTDSNGFVDVHSERFRIEAKEYCDVRFEIPDIAFVDPSVPLESEVETWIASNGPFNVHTILYSVGEGTDANPDHVWHYTCEE